MSQRVGEYDFGCTEAIVADELVHCRTSHSNKLKTVTEVLAIVFGLIIALVILLLLAYWLLRKRYDRNRAKEHSFRLGRAEHAAAEASSTQTNLEDKSPGVVRGYISPGSINSQNRLHCVSSTIFSIKIM